MSTTDEMTDLEVAAAGPEVAATAADPTLALELNLQEAEALRAWLLKATVEGITALDNPPVNDVLTKLGGAVDRLQAAANIRREFEQAGMNVSHLSDDQLRDLGRRVSEAALPGVR